MQGLMCRTSLGEVPVFFRPGRPPLVFAIRGAFAGRETLTHLPAGEEAWAFVRLPGFDCPWLADDGLTAAARAYDEVLDKMFPGTPVLVLGASTGCLPALAMRRETIGARLLIEPFFRTGGVWAWHEWLRGRTLADPKLADWVWRTFGVNAAGHEDRDYRQLVTEWRPTVALVGSEPLMPPRPMQAFPSFASEDDRAWLRAQGAELVVAEGGHNLPMENPAAIRAVIERMIRPPAAAD